MLKLRDKLHIISEKLHLPSLPNWLSGLLAFILVLRIPSFFEPFYYGDEMIYLTLGQAIRQGVPLYSMAHDNKPPLLYITAAIAGNLFLFKVILAFWNLITIIFFYKLSKKLFEGNEKAQKVSTFIFALATTLPLLEGLTVNSEIFMIAFTIVAVLILLGKNLTYKKIYFAGILFGLGALFKIPAAFDLPAIVFFWIITRGFRDWKKIFVDTFVLGMGFLTPILLTFVWFFFKGALPEYIRAAFMQNVGYLSSFRPGDVQKPFLVKNGPLLMRALIVMIGSVVVFIFRNKLSKKFILATLWLLFALFAITLSERPYPHYLIQAMAPIAILLGIFFADKSFEQSLTVIPLALAFFVPVFYKFWFYPTSTYYVRFINFATHRTTREQYFDGFNGNINRDYKIAEFLSTSSTTKDRVFMYDPDSPAVYSLSRRLPPTKYVVDYHILDYSTKAIEAKK
jgi:4-amino-4-deoxy-L-arabinose transferase-like glycosyltransferase